MTIVIQFDGGCQPNPGEKYGSYEVRFDGVVVARELRIKFGHGTNNEAEFDSLIAALNAAHEKWIAARRPVCHVNIATDSTIVENRVGLKSRRAKKAFNRITRAVDMKRQQNLFTEPAAVEKQLTNSRMTNLMAKCLEILNQFDSYEINYIPRGCNVSKFGH